MTSAPSSARCSDPNGPAPYCSSETIRTSSSGSMLTSVHRQRLGGLGERVLLGQRPTLVHVEGADEAAHHGAVLVERAGADGDDAQIGRASCRDRVSRYVAERTLKSRIQR